MMMDKDDSLMVIKTLIIRGADKFTRTDKNESCMSLVPKVVQLDAEKMAKV